MRDGLRFTTTEQRREVELDRRRAGSPRSPPRSSARSSSTEFLETLERGLAPHHAGMVPAFREIVEACFERNLLGAVFATETLALGINMPARSVALERFTKYSDAGRATLTSGEFAQMTGRAGRRGLDDEGHAVVCFSIETSLVDVGRVATAPPPDLHSSFRPTYNLTANLIHHFDLATATEVVERSFAQFEADRRPAATRWPLAEQMLARHRVLEELGYAQGWRLTDQGQLLRAIYHECDLLVAEAIAEGLFDGLGARGPGRGGVGALLRGQAHPARGARAAPAPSRRRAVNDRLGPRAPGRPGRARRGARVARRAGARRRGAPPRAPRPRPRRPLRHHRRRLGPGRALRARARRRRRRRSARRRRGDFVRQAKQVADLCEQLARLHHRDEVAAAARGARDSLLRSVVVAGTGVHPLAEGRP